MKKIISSVIAIAMLSSTVAMAATVVAPVPQTTKAVETQNFNNAESQLDSETGRLPGWAGFGKVALTNYSDQKYEVVNNPFDSETTTDKVIKLGNDILKDDSNNQPTASFTIEDGAFLGGDIVKFSFELALKNASSNSNIEVTTTYNNETTGTETGGAIIQLYKGGYVASHFRPGQDQYDHAFSSTEFKKYTVTINRITDTMVVEYPKADGTGTYTINLADDKKIDSIKKIALTLRHEKKDTGTPEFYINNFSCEVATPPDEMVEEFDGVVASSDTVWGRPYQLSNAKFYAYGTIVGNTQNFDTASNRGNVLSLENAADQTLYVAMPLNYTMDNDDVFTFSFDYAFSKADGSTLGFYLNSTDASGNGAKVHLKATDGNFEYNITNGKLFEIIRPSGEFDSIWVNGNSENQDYSEDMQLNPNTFYTITVVIDNSDETCPDGEGNAQRTLAIYLGNKLYRNTKWIMTDAAGENNSTITGVSLVCTGKWSTATRYFDNLWASLTENTIAVDGDDVSYTYPVVYNDATQAIFVKAYYDVNNRLISADTASATPNAGRTVKTTLEKPANTAKTKVFRWDSLDNIKNLSPAYDSSKTSN